MRFRVFFLVYFTIPEFNIDKVPPEHHQDDPAEAANIAAGQAFGTAIASFL